MTITDAQRTSASREAQRIALSNWPYEFGGLTVAGIDCSGLFIVCWSKAGVPNLPHNTGMLAVQLEKAGQLKPFNWDNFQSIKPGDALFYYGTTPENTSHMAMFIEHYEGINVIAQATDVAHGTELIRMEKYAVPRYIGYMR